MAALVFGAATASCAFYKAHGSIDDVRWLTSMVDVQEVGSLVVLARILQ